MRDLLNMIGDDELQDMVHTLTVTLCGSARFEPLFHEWNERLTFAGCVVIGLSVYPSMKQGDKNWYTEDQKDTLDLIHLTKIVHSHAIVVLNPDGYIGDSTRREVAFAAKLMKGIYYLEGEPNVRSLLLPQAAPRDVDDYRTEEP